MRAKHVITAIGFGHDCDGPSLDYSPGCIPHPLRRCVHAGLDFFVPDLSTATTTAPSPTPTVSSEKNILVDPLAGPPTALSSLPHTSIAAHAPGWTLFRDLYMSNGTLLIVSPSKEDFPEIRMMSSTGLSAENTPENIALREPTKETMDFLTPERAHQRWGSEDESVYRVLSVKGNTVSLLRSSCYSAYIIATDRV